jgi:pimeloyl-ACP methyl ester carboxylesterase
MQTNRLAAVSLLALAVAGCATARAARPTVETGVVTAADGVPLVYDVRGAGEPAVLLVHGWRCDRALWRWTADELARERRVVCVDMAGHGDSGAAGRAKWDVEALGADVQAVVEALDLRRVVLVGHSMGGPVCLDAARRMPDRVVAVVGVDTLHDVEFHWPKEQADQAVAALEADPRKALRDFLPSMLGPHADPASLEWIVEHALRADDRAAAALMRSMTTMDATALLGRAGKPVRCVNAAPGATQFAIPTNVATNRKYADFDAVLMEGVGHYPMIERPLSFVARLRETLATLR